MYIIETERLKLRNILENDAEFIKKLVNEPSWIQNIGNRNINSTSDAQEYIRSRMTDSYQKNGFGLYLVELKDSRKPIGMCGLVKRDPSEDPDIGFALIPEVWGKDYAVEASRGVLHYAKNTLKLKRILGITIPSNIPSIKTLEKIGLKFERMSVAKEDGKDIRVYSINF